jgi:hypothetical protein
VRLERTIAALGFAVLVSVAASGCRSDPSTPRGTAELFLDAHYVEIDLPRALPLTSGVARQKVEHEIDLVKGFEIDDTTRKPIVRYSFLEEHPGDDGSMKFLYHGKILVDGADGLERRWLVTVRQEAEGWRVTNYQEISE